MILALLLACGVEGGMGKPEPPPVPPERFSAPDDGTVQIDGTLAEVSPSTRSFTVNVDGRLRYGILTGAANVLRAGHAVGLEGLAPGEALHVTGALHGDVVVASRVTVGEDAPEAAIEGTGAPGDAGAAEATAPPAADASSPRDPPAADAATGAKHGP